MNRKQQLGRVRGILLKYQRDLVRTTASAREELSALKAQERDPEFEERAQIDSTDDTLSRLIEGQRRELIMIQAALRRMDEQVFGQCVDCGAEIPIERLEALPFALRCEEDASRRELETRPLAAGSSL